MSQRVEDIYASWAGPDGKPAYAFSMADMGKAPGITHEVTVWRMMPGRNDVVLYRGPMVAALAYWTASLIVSVKR